MTEQTINKSNEFVYLRAFYFNYKWIGKGDFKI